MPIKTHVDEPPAINMTSMVDVVFLLVIFFMVGTRFTDFERKVQLQVPAVNETAAPTSPPQDRVINVYRDGQITLDRKTVSLKELTRQLASARRQSETLGVVVRGDGGGRYSRIAEVLNACKQAGITELGISVRLASTAR